MIRGRSAPREIESARMAKIDDTRCRGSRRGEKSDGCAPCEFDRGGSSDAARGTGDDGNPAGVDDRMDVAVDRQEGFETPVGRGRATDGWAKG